MFTTLIEVLSNVFCYVGFIRSNTFLQPLNSEDEAACIALLKDKDEESRNKLIEHNLRLVAHIVKKYDIKKEQVEDLISIGTIGLIKAVDSFKPEKGHKLTTYASRCIENEILMYLRSSKNYFQNVSLNDPIATDKDGSEITLIDAIASPEDSTVIDEMMKKDRIARLKEYIHILDEREMEIITKRFGLYGEEEKTQREIARQLHISRSYVSRIEKRAFMKLYREFQKEEKRKERSLKSS
ncbi:RNA polymerase sporulation sigma factor SigK [Erysipelotrichaceae bacterium HCN-30851]|mgnify:CR=1 FL=1